MKLGLPKPPPRLQPLSNAKTSPYQLFHSRFVDLGASSKRRRLSLSVVVTAPYVKSPPALASGNATASVLQSENVVVDPEEAERESLRVEFGSAKTLAGLSPPKFSLSDQASFLLAFIACTTSVAFTSLCIAAVPTLLAMGRAAISFSKLADTAREELPSTMAAIRLSGMEISDLTLELSDLSQEIAEGVSKSTQAVQAAEAGIRQIGSMAHQQTMSLIQERANLPEISLRPVVVGAARKTTRAVGDLTKNFINLFSGNYLGSENEDYESVEELEP